MKIETDDKGNQVIVYGADKKNHLTGWKIYEEFGPIKCSKDIWENLSEIEKKDWIKMNEEIVERNDAAWEKFLQREIL